MTLKSIILWVTLILACFQSTPALTITAPEKRVWEVFSIGYDAAITEATIGYDNPVRLISAYDTTPIHRATTETKSTDAEHPLFGPNAEFKAAETAPTQLEFDFVNSLPEKPPINWPPNRGFAGDPVPTTLSPGTMVDKYGYNGGTFVSPQGVPYIQRSLAPGTQYKPYNLFQVMKPIDVNGGSAAPAFGMPGNGMQYELPSSVQSLIDSGHLQSVTGG